MVRGQQCLGLTCGIYVCPTVWPINSPVRRKLSCKKQVDIVTSMTLCSFHTKNAPMV